MFVLFIIFLLAYIIVFNSQVIYNSKYDTAIFFPFWDNEILQVLVRKAGSKYNAIGQYGPQAIIDAISYKPAYIHYTQLIFILLYAGTFEFLILGFGLPAFKSSNEND